MSPELQADSLPLATQDAQDHYSFTYINMRIGLRVSEKHTHLSVIKILKIFYFLGASSISKRALLQDAARSIFTGKKVYCFLFTTCVGDLDGNAEFCDIAPLEVT